jgi:hypothetical protein
LGSNFEPARVKSVSDSRRMAAGASIEGGLIFGFASARLISIA